MSRAYVGVTDNDWYRLLRSIDGIDEVNFWTPSGQLLNLEPGQPFLFKLHSPINKIAGGAFFSHATVLPVSLAWDAFGTKNGARSLLEMRKRLGKYRHFDDLRADYNIGCLILQDPFFLHEEQWFEAPDWHPNIVRGKYYDVNSEAGRALWSRALSGRHLVQATQVSEQVPMWGDPTMVRPRLGQGTFRVKVTDIYHRRCAVTGEKALPVLEAAHIKPVSDGGEHRTDNGILLRSDVHALFDHGYVTVTPEFRIEVSNRLKDEFDNGEHYRPYHGSAIAVPETTADRPGKNFLEWHNAEVFR